MEANEVRITSVKFKGAGRVDIELNNGLFLTGITNIKMDEAEALSPQTVTLSATVEP
jgi:hypothetical protein